MRHKQHLTFTHRCKENEITPSSLRIHCPINTEKARNIIKRAEKELINERIRVVSNKIRHLTEKRDLQNQSLETLNIDDRDVVSHLEKHVQNKRKHEEKKTKQWHTAKLNRLKSKNEAKITEKNNKEIDLSGTELKKWRKNGSETYRIVSLPSHKKSYSQGELTSPCRWIRYRTMSLLWHVNRLMKPRIYAWR